MVIDTYWLDRFLTWHVTNNVLLKPLKNTGISFLEAFIILSTNPQHDKRLFIDLPVLYMKTTSSEHVVYTFFCFDIQNNLCTQHVLSL